jgi:hypothetical protein
MRVPHRDSRYPLEERRPLAGSVRRMGSAVTRARAAIAQNTPQPIENTPPNHTPKGWEA